ncbi:MULTISPECIES: YihY/virulence factor BrkB family protein [unclassified Amycolatopsis]|uniref:YihY/virulence factor BrkB family protein n=1 Tax=unclassified Amycolatopsis TaxID=2618356 RepID=UPI0028742552|nr:MULTISPECIES: YihY/virulence factor BrkB family protein [unclassified Amycolatopsis]MDS0138402.1 YihY/virulence factor BrkB family protein [Amycolatopsis sp. 505]MDS0146321.1 YihY/virulence factor BrkB family protein [Amycolatopsis sp. CM201R]
MGEVQPSGATKVARKGPWRLLTRTFAKAWEGNIFSEAAEAAFWQTLSLPPLLLGLLGSLGFVGEWFGAGVVTAVHDRIIGFCRTVFSTNAVQDIIEPTVNSILTVGKGEIVSVGFLISLWAGSSAMSSFVDAITVAHDQYGVRNDVWQRIFALLLYLCGLVILVVGLPLLAIGPDLLPEFFPLAWRPTVTSWVSALYFPTLGVMITLALTTLYKLALPRKLPWHRGLPGAVLAMVVFLLSSVGLRVYLNWITKTGYTYGALAAPIAFLLLMFFIGLAVVGGAYFNSAIQELWPAKATRRQRRKWRRLEMERASERLRSEDGRKLWDRTTTPLKRPHAEDVTTNGSEPEPSEEDTPSPSAPEPAPSAAQGRGSTEGTTRNPPPG